MPGIYQRAALPADRLRSRGWRAEMKCGLIAAAYRAHVEGNV